MMFKKSFFAKAPADEAKNEENKEEEKEVSLDNNEDFKDVENDKSVEDKEESAEDVEEIKEISKEEEYLNGLKRCQADFENYRKRQEESKKELKDFILEDLVLQILPVVDNFEMSLSHIPEDQGKSPWVEGILHIQRQLETILKDNGISEIEVKEGDAFNPEIHEAIHSENNGESKIKNQESSNRISKVICKGYKIGEKVIRAAKVIVN